MERVTLANNVDCMQALLLWEAMEEQAACAIRHGAEDRIYALIPPPPPSLDW